MNLNNIKSTVPIKASAPNPHQPLLGLSRAELEAFAQQHNFPVYRGRQLYKWIYHERQANFRAMTDLPVAMRDALVEHASVSPLKIVKNQAGYDGSLKLLLEATDGARIESVLIPEGERMTACLSSQVGCAVGCKFCATGLMGFTRNLTAGEIIAQLFAIEQAAGRPMTNIVMMGMGEPLLNRPALFKAIPILTDPEGVGISRRHFTVSTAGWLPGIVSLTEAVRKGRHKEKSFAELGAKRQLSATGYTISSQTSAVDGDEEAHPKDAAVFPRVKLALSLNSTTDEERRELMPLAGRYPLRETLAAAGDYARASGERVSVNYLLLAGKNDSDDDARRLRGLVKQAGGKATAEIFKTNIMEYNDVGAEFLRASPERREAFARILSDSGLQVTVRTSRGRDIAAACGQLASREN